MAEGAYVFITGRRQAELDRAVQEIGPRAVGIRANSSNLADLDGFYDRVKIEKGRIDVLFANADGGSMLPLGSITEEQYEDTFGRNVKGVLFTVQKALPLLVDGASVILTGSTAAAGGTAAFSVYAASKAAVRAFARNWILDLKERRIRVNVISPGPTRTPGLVDLAGPDAAQQQGLLDHTAAQVPLGRVGDPTRSQGPLSSWLRTVRASSPAPSFSSTAAWRKSEALQRLHTALAARRPISGTGIRSCRTSSKCSCCAPNDRAQRRIGFHRRGIDADPLALDQAMRCQTFEDPGEDLAWTSSGRRLLVRLNHE